MKIFHSKILTYLIIEIPIIILIAKAYFINTIFINHENTFYYRVFQTIAHDSIIFFFILLLTFLSYQSFLKYFIGVLIRVIALIFFLIYIIDIYILNQFATHLVLNDIIKYLNYAPQYIEQMYKLSIISLLIFIFCFILSIFFIFKRYLINKIQNYFFLTILSMTIIINQFSQEGRYIHSWLYKNFIEYNYSIYDQSKEYSQEFKKKQRNHNLMVCSKTEKTSHKNIIILMVESLASYQSSYFSGIKGWTPQLDKIAEENISFKNFYANGFVTEDAEIAMITGKFPIYSPSAFSNGGGVSFNGFYNIEETLPNLLKKYNYNSEFITSSDLKFSNTGEWALSNGFGYIEGSEHPYYKGKERFHFKAAADEYLYKRVLDRVSKQDSKYFLFIKTVTSHAPFKNPENHSSSEEETIRYVDKQIGVFYNSLKEKNFFKDGILMIMGDHHPVIPLRKEELQKYGEFRASSIVPLIIINEKKKKTISNYYQQTDIYNSIKNLISEDNCNSIWYGDLLSKEDNTPKYILHRRGDQRGIISVFNKDNEFNIKLLGDKTHILKGRNNQEVIDKINTTRMNRENSKYNFKKEL